MAERVRAGERLRIGPPRTIGGVTLLTIERVAWQAGFARSGAWGSVVAAPYAVVVHDDSGVRAFGVDAAAIPLARLCTEVPTLEAALAAL